MSTHVVNEFFAQSGRGEDVENLLIEDAWCGIAAG